VVVDVGLSPVLLVHITVRDMHVVHGGMVVLVRMGGEKMTPVLPLMHVVGDVVMLVPVLQGVVRVMTLRPRHRVHLSPGRTSRTDRPYTARKSRTNELATAPSPHGLALESEPVDPRL
jgi:hypothetical protein